MAPVQDVPRALRGAHVGDHLAAGSGVDGRAPNAPNAPSRPADSAYFRHFRPLAAPATTAQNADGDGRARGGARGGANAPRGSSASPRASLWPHSSPRTRASVRCHSTRAQRRCVTNMIIATVARRADAQRHVHVPPLVGIRSKRWTGPFQARVVSVPATRGCPSVRVTQRERLGGYNPISSRPNLVRDRREPRPAVLWPGVAVASLLRKNAG